MSIINIHNSYNQRSLIKETPENKRTEERKNLSVEQKSVTSEDKISLSDTSKEMIIAKEAVESVPDSEIRTDKIERLKQAINDGTYEVNAEKIAEKMIGFLVDDFI